ncbi:MAG: TIGR03790 family protein [Verrucomicrobia bacterium]|nr:TIGR03790 family protein [Verrucomicrobiota bacterium]
MDTVLSSAIPRSWRRLLVALSLAFLPWLALAVENWTDRMLIVANKALPDSVSLARYYASRRSVATNRIFLVNCPQTLEISRQQFNDTLRDPIERHLEERGWLARDERGAVKRNDCWLLALCWGVPLKIASDPALQEKTAERMPSLFRRNEAAVDSELATLPSGRVTLTGPRDNPFYKMEFFPPASRRMMMVARLDGPDVAAARALVNRALAVETTGLLGRAYFDARGSQDGGHKIADDYLRAAHQAARRAGFESVLDEKAEVFPADYPMTDVALYAGWYAGQLAGAVGRRDFRFRPGAVVHHIHSFSAATMNSGWVGPCLARGAGAGVGNVYEPYLQLVLNSQVFFERLLSGRNFAESAYAATPALSWQQTVVGDPLYRPCLFSANEQADRLEATRHPDFAWACLRKANTLIAAGKEPDAVRYLTEKNASLRSPVLDEKLGSLHAQAGRFQEAVAACKRAKAAYRNTYDIVRVSNSLADFLLKLDKTAEALAVLDDVIRRHPGYEGHRFLLKNAATLAVKLGDNAKLDYYTKLLPPSDAAAGSRKK